MWKGYLFPEEIPSINEVNSLRSIFYLGVMEKCRLKVAKGTKRIVLHFTCLGIVWFLDVEHVIAACVLFDLRTEDTPDDHFLCGASLLPLLCCFQT